MTTPKQKSNNMAKESILSKIRSFLSQIRRSISNFFKPDNIEEIPVSSLPTFLKNSLSLIERIVSHYKPGQKGGISFDVPVSEKDSKKSRTTLAKKAPEKNITKTKNNKTVNNSEKSNYKDLDELTNILKGNKSTEKEIDERE